MDVEENIRRMLVKKKQGSKSRMIIISLSKNEYFLIIRFVALKKI